MKVAAIKVLNELHSTIYSEYRDYSGRGMYGKMASVAFKVNKSPNTETGSRLVDMGFAVDNLGLDYIYYTKG
jgi:hypothetical protein